MTAIQTDAAEVVPPARKPATPPAPRATGAANAQPEAARFGWLMLQLAVLLFVVTTLNFGRGASVSLPLPLCISAFAAFAIHYWLPFSVKKQGFVLLSWLAVFAAVGPQDWSTIVTARFWDQMLGAARFLGVIVLVGLAFYGALRLPIGYWFRIALVLVVAGVLVYGRAQQSADSPPLWLSPLEWATLGGLFMFRMILYCKEIQVARKPESLIDFLCYFFLLPNYFFPLFPVIDYTTFKRGYYAKNIHVSAQKGIFWMVRGLVQLCIFRWLYHNEIASEKVQDLGMLIVYLFQFYLQYMRVSGLFHFIIGMMHLFGWELPETNRKYLLASSLTDFWRRINIYWKDFMIKAFYYPVYFRLRKAGDLVALSVATMVVFIATTVLHGYQYFWIKGDFAIFAQDYIFWGALGVIVMFTVLYENKRGKPKPRPKAVAAVLTVVQTVAVYVTISILWSLWTIPPREWWDVVSYAVERSFS